MAMRENDLAVAKLVISLIIDEHRNEVDQLDSRLLVLIDLRSFDFDQFVTHILSYVESNLVLKHVLDHLVVLCL